MKKIEELIRPHLLHLTPYSSARDEFSGNKGIFLDANENSFGSVMDKGFNRYPDPYQYDLKKKLARIKNVIPDRIFLGNGSDEPIDLIIRIFCEPGIDNIIVMPPTYDMYEISATIHNTEVRKVPLTSQFEIDTESVLNKIDQNTKLIFLCSPNNPTGNSFDRNQIVHILREFEGITVIDEAYIDFSASTGFLQDLEYNDNLIILQTMSKAWGFAGIRLGIAFAREEIIRILNKIKYPYNINAFAREEIIRILNKIKYPYNINVSTQKIITDALNFENRKNEMVNAILDQRSLLENRLNDLEIVEKVYSSDANFLLVRFKDASSVYTFLLSHNIIVRNRSKLALCENSLRITVGTPEENAALIGLLKNFKSE
jgi:histidinol-phosphate aminotransferase